MKRPEFDIRIDKSGRVTVEVKGSGGPECLELADLLKDILGREDERTLTSEYYTPDSKVRIDVHVRDRGGA
ncbi:MAG: hypothetical protein AMXMBFR47_39490 [Planctomycetota bacterium]